MEEAKRRAADILRILKQNFSVPSLSSICEDPFKVLIRTIISQSTAEVNTRRAFKNLSVRLPVTPESLAEADGRLLQDVLRVAGLHRNKSRAIKDLSRMIVEKYDGSLDFIYSSPLEDARERLMNLPGVGPKTADIVLLFCARRPVLPVDTHVNRVSKRLGLAQPKGDYEEVRSGLQTLYLPEEYFQVHMLLIALGRKYCRSLKPLCFGCPVTEICPSSSIFSTLQLTSPSQNETAS